MGISPIVRMLYYQDGFAGKFQFWFWIFTLAREYFDMRRTTKLKEARGAQEKNFQFVVSAGFAPSASGASDGWRPD